MVKLIQALKGYEAVKELISHELEDYSYFNTGDLEWNDSYGDYKESDEEEHYKIEIKGHDEYLKTLYFNYNKESEKIEIEIGEDSWYEVRVYDNTIKYFWMALLKW
jgi:hypothetical protein